MLTNSEIIKHFQDKDIDELGTRYLMDHIKRFKFLIEVLNDIIIEEKNQLKKVLIVSPSFELELIHKAFPDLILHSIGIRGIHLAGEHINYNLNEADISTLPLKVRDFDIVIMCEVIEHLALSGKIVFKFISQLIKKNGYLIIQTPNAKSLRYKVKKNIKHERHKCVYAIEDIKNSASTTGFKLKKYYFRNYYTYPTIRCNLYNLGSIFLCPSLKEGMTGILTMDKIK